jgi:hypothetical protein
MATGVLPLLTENIIFFFEKESYSQDLSYTTRRGAWCILFVVDAICFTRTRSLKIVNRYSRHGVRRVCVRDVMMSLDQNLNDDASIHD